VVADSISQMGGWSLGSDPLAFRIGDAPRDSMKQNTSFEDTCLRTVDLLLVGSTLSAGGTDEWAGNWPGKLKIPFDSKPMEFRIGLEQGPTGIRVWALEADIFGRAMLRGEVEDREGSCEMRDA
jgi:hypothetical protein